MRRLYVGTTDTNGGMPLVQEDLKLIQDAIAEAVGAGLNLFGTNSYIITGCQPTDLGGGMQGHTAGVVVINGEVCIIDEDTVGLDTADEHDFVFKKVNTFDAAGLKVFASGGAAINTYQVTKAVLVVDSAPTGDYAGYPLVRQETLIAQSIAPIAIQFGNLIGFHKGTSASLSAGVGSLPNDGNWYEMAIASADSLNSILCTHVYYPAGTFVFIRFTGVSGNQVTVNNGSGIVTPDAKPRIFYAGDFCIFMSTGSGGFALATSAGKGQWKVPAISLNSWGSSGPTRFRYCKASDGRLTLDGYIAKNPYTTVNEPFFTLPVADRPSVDKTFNILSVGNQPVTIFIDSTTGDMNINIAGVTAAPVQVWLCGISFYLD